MDLGTLNTYIKESKVNPSQAHFEIRYGDFSEERNLIYIAKIALGDNFFILDWLTPEECTEDIRMQVSKNIQFYLIDRVFQQNQTLVPNDVWKYMQYHASNSTANIYGLVHWVFINEQVV